MNISLYYIHRNIDSTLINASEYYTDRNVYEYYTYINICKYYTHSNISFYVFFFRNTTQIGTFLNIKFIGTFLNTSLRGIFLRASFPPLFLLKETSTYNRNDDMVFSPCQFQEKCREQQMPIYFDSINQQRHSTLLTRKVC